MNMLRQAAVMALEALEYGQHTLKQVSENQWESRGQLAMDALLAALAEPVQEQPVCDECGKSKCDGWALYCVKCVEPMFTSKKEPVEPVQDGKCKHCVDGCPACDARKLPVQEPVAWMNTEDGFCTLDSPVEGIDVMSQWVPLYTAPPQRKPLTEEEIIDLWAGVSDPESPDISMIDFARAIERAYGIT